MLNLWNLYKSTKFRTRILLGTSRAAENRVLNIFNQEFFAVHWHKIFTSRRKNYIFVFNAQVTLSCCDIRFIFYRLLVEITWNLPAVKIIWKYLLTCNCKFYFECFMFFSLWQTFCRTFVRKYCKNILEIHSHHNCSSVNLFIENVYEPTLWWNSQKIFS